MTIKYTDLELGRPYKLPHGVGVYVGYEEFFNKGMNSRVVKEKPKHESGRKMFRLKEGHTWSGDTTCFYCCWMKDIEPMEPEDSDALKVGDKLTGAAGEWTVTHHKDYYVCLKNTEDKNLTISYSPNNVLALLSWEGHIAWPYSYGGSFDRQPQKCRYETLELALANFVGEPD